MNTEKEYGFTRDEVTGDINITNLNVFKNAIVEKLAEIAIYEENQWAVDIFTTLYDDGKFDIDDETTIAVLSSVFDEPLGNFYEYAEYIQQENVAN